jgi:hypothetical protein
MKLTTILALGSGVIADLMSERTNFDHEDSNAKRIRELCPCSDEAMGKMKMAMTEYQIDQKTHPGKTTVDNLVKNIKKIAFECTSRPECRCPEGYFKTRDGTECLKFSESTANCMEAEKACDADFNSRLAIAKDQARLDKIAGIMEEIAGEDEFYWIGLSYNKTSNNGDADWRWSDGNKASGELVDDLNMQLKKSGRLNADTRMLDIEFNDQTPVERVAISSKQHGKFWKHESCRASGKTGPPKHKYICEFMMFKVRINAERKNGQYVGRIGEF